MRQLVRVGDAAQGTDKITFHFQRDDTENLPLDPQQQRGKAVRLDQFEGTTFRRTRQKADNGSCPLVSSLERMRHRPRNLPSPIRPTWYMIRLHVHPDGKN